MLCKSEMSTLGSQMHTANSFKELSMIHANLGQSCDIAYDDFHVFKCLNFLLKHCRCFVAHTGVVQLSIPVLESGRHAAFTGLNWFSPLTMCVV